MKQTLIKITGALALVTLVACAPAEQVEARDTIRIVGSSTVFPFSTAVAEEFGRSTSFKTPIVESTGTGGGFKLFCSGVGVDTPDVSNASRAIKSSEVENCAANGVTSITEVKIGFDGIVLARAKTGDPINLTLQQVFLALAKDVLVDGELKPNPYKMWNEIDPSLPAKKIEVYGPPPTSGTRDAFEELAMEGGCKTFTDIKALKDSDKNRYKAICHGIREDGAYIEAGENDNLIVQKLTANPDALGIFGYSFLEQNGNVVEGSLIGGEAPTFDNISSGIYPVSRALYFYVKNAHAGSIPGLKEFVTEFVSDKAMGEFGYLGDKGLIPLPPEEAEQVRAQATSLTPLASK